MKATAEQFIEAWQGATSAGEVAERLNLSLSATYGRAAYFRKNGVPLKAMRGARHDWQALAALAQKFSKEEKNGTS